MVSLTNYSCQDQRTLTKGGRLSTVDLLIMVAYFVI
jgi:hypothetical protein